MQRLAAGTPVITYFRPSTLTATAVDAIESTTTYGEVTTTGIGSLVASYKDSAFETIWTATPPVAESRVGSSELATAGTCMDCPASCWAVGVLRDET